MILALHHATAGWATLIPIAIRRAMHAETLASTINAAVAVPLLGAGLIAKLVRR